MNNQMTEVEFNNLYQQALLKVAIGIYVIKQVGQVQQASEKDIIDGIEAWCHILADGFQLNVASVIHDATALLDSFPPAFIKSASFKTLMGELANTVSYTKCMPGQKR